MCVFEAEMLTEGRGREEGAESFLYTRREVCPGLATSCCLYHMQSCMVRYRYMDLTIGVW